MLEIFKGDVTHYQCSSNLVAFYFGNLTNPSVDPPRIGLLSTVPSNADELFSSVVSAAEATGGQFESESFSQVSLSRKLTELGSFLCISTNRNVPGN